MKEVIRNHTHGSSIMLSICKEAENHYLKKSAYDESGIVNLVRETEGYRWYLDGSRPEFPIKTFALGRSYLELRIPFFQAQDPIRKNLTKTNLKYFYLAIDHYNQTWPESVCANAALPIHGDFSLDGNILFNDQGVFVIDWEHFTEGAAPRGFDVLYMVFEAIKISCKRYLPTTRLLSLSRMLLLYGLEKGAISDHYSENLFAIFLKEQDRLATTWGAQFEKLPTALFSERQKKILIEYFAGQ